jgi:UDP-N-acetylmuramate--alanine ligase
VLEEVQRQSGQDVTYVQEKEKLASFLAGEVQEGDLVITMGAGDIYKTGEELVEMLKK